MNIILLTAIASTVALVRGGHGAFDGNSVTDALAEAPSLEPCQNRSHMDRYDSFVRHHVINKSFDRNSLDEWRKYLEGERICGERPNQALIDTTPKNIRQVCTRGGWRLQRTSSEDEGNLCISKSSQRMYIVQSNNLNGCTVTNVKPLFQKVVLACDIVQNRCLPVHLEPYWGQQPIDTDCSH